jgi:hypothetical protein
MSHFAVLVIGKDMDDVERLLAPYQENNMGDCPRQFLVFNDTEDDDRYEYENESVDMLKSPDGELVYKWDERFKKAPTYGILDLSYGTRAEILDKVMEGYTEVCVPHKSRFASFEEFCKDWHGAERDPEMNRYGYWENPNKKWDWYELGGRWQGAITLKDGSTADQAVLKDINLDAITGAWALVTPDGQWHERGNMGWWGLNDATADSTAQFNKLLEETIKAASPELIMAAIDCRI